MPQEQSSTRQHDSFASRPPPPPHQQEGKEKTEKKRSVSFLKDQIKEKIKGEKSTTKDPKKGSTPSSSSSILKTSLVFLGSVAAATYVANRVWARSITYYEKEERGEGTRRRQQQDRRMRRSASRRSSFDDEGSPRLYKGGDRGLERVVFEDQEPIRRALSRDRSEDPKYTVVEVIPGSGGSRPVSGRQEQQRYIETCHNSRAGDGRRSSSSHYHYYRDGDERRYYSPARQHGGDGDGLVVDDVCRNPVYREPRYVKHQVTTLRRSSYDSPYTTTERVVRRQYHIDER